MNKRTLQTFNFKNVFVSMVVVGSMSTGSAADIPRAVRLGTPVYRLSDTGAKSETFDDLVTARGKFTRKGNTLEIRSEYSNPALRLTRPLPEVAIAVIEVKGLHADHMLRFTLPGGHSIEFNRELNSLAIIGPEHKQLKGVEDPLALYTPALNLVKGEGENDVFVIQSAPGILVVWWNGEKVLEKDGLSPDPDQKEFKMVCGWHSDLVVERLEFYRAP